MYTEFVIIYIGMGILALLSIASIALLIIVMKKMGNGFSGNPERYSSKPQNYGHNNAQVGVVFCKNCGTQFDGATHVCPKCGTPR